ncbi:DUF1353 domain-containing protein [Vibrio mediterranei]|uniref:DUF1353 domain-containing protein n=1 Tax=Vibrio sp. La 4.2.2 TaxID=2998830 RepID=UPI0022CDD979|nr:DUF1353 domain-containing protein [Vibrio sp. La 4.2.2]MDA0107693.1 DUF1353 domain-containing protein [Vibrio sp. La 4.2.2]
MAFSGEPLTRWSGSRNMNLEEDFYFIDNQGTKWNAPKGSCLNGATIPRALWTAIGSPYSGTYRKSSIVHDVAVGELCNPDVSNEDRKKADRMFYEACRHEGCSRRFAAILYIGVRFGSWSAQLSSVFKSANLSSQEIYRNNPENEYVSQKFWEIVDSAESYLETEDLDQLDMLVETKLD